jgi:hypothetical protein
MGGEYTHGGREWFVLKCRIDSSGMSPVMKMERGPFPGSRTLAAYR